MSAEKFIGYIQEPDVHDGLIIGARYRSSFFRSVFDKREVSVVLFTFDQRLFVIAFRKVRSAIVNNVKGMRLYSLSEMYAMPPFRRFVFVNSDEDSKSQLEVVAREISSVELTAEFVPREAITHLRKLFPQKPR